MSREDLSLYAVFASMVCCFIAIVFFTYPGNTTQINFTTLDRWIGAQYAITCFDSWETGNGITTYSSDFQAPQCTFDVDGERIPLEYSVNYYCNGHDNLTYTLGDESWGLVWPGCDNENVADNIQVQVR